MEESMLLNEDLSEIVNCSGEECNYTIYDNHEILNLIEFPLAFQVTIHLLYGFVFVTGVLGNTLVCYVVFTAPRMQTVTNYFLANLALGDLLIGILCSPGYIVILLQYWPLGTPMCHIMAPAKAIGVFVSSYTLIALAVDRYMAILYPLKPRLRKTHALIVIGIIWVAAFITAIPVGIFTTIEIHMDSGRPRCAEYGWETETQELTYNLVLMMLQYFFPVLVLIFTYTRISLVVWGKQTARKAVRKANDGKRKTVIMSLAVVIGYTLAWLPYNLSYFITSHLPEYMEHPSFPYTHISCHFLSMLHTAYNPFIYGWINSKFRSAFAEVLRKLHCYASCLTTPEPTWKTTSWRSSRTSSRDLSRHTKSEHVILVRSPVVTSNPVIVITNGNGVETSLLKLPAPENSAL